MLNDASDLVYSSHSARGNVLSRSERSTLPFSIVIPSQRRTDLLQLCLESISQHAPDGAEIIVVDDGSPNAIVSLTALRFPQVRTIRLTRSQGFCVAANRGIMSARGEIIELLNDDTQVVRGWAEPALACFNDPRIGAVAPLVLRGTPGEADPLIDSAGDGYDRGGFAWKNGHRQRLTEDYLHAGTVAGASASSVFLRRSALERSGLFSERFGAYFEDVDLSLRLLATGYRTYYEPASRVWHRGGSSYGRPQAPTRRTAILQRGTPVLASSRSDQSVASAGPSLGGFGRQSRPPLPRRNVPAVRAGPLASFR